MIILILLIIAFTIYMFLNDGYIYIASKHFEKEISTNKLKNKLIGDKKNQNHCNKCGRVIAGDEKTCDRCILRETNVYNNFNDYRDKKN